MLSKLLARSFVDLEHRFLFAARLGQTRFYDDPTDYSYNPFPLSIKGPPSPLMYILRTVSNIRGASIVLPEHGGGGGGGIYEGPIEF